MGKIPSGNKSYQLLNRKDLSSTTTYNPPIPDIITVGIWKLNTQKLNTTENRTRSVFEWAHHPISNICAWISNTTWNLTFFSLWNLDCQDFRCHLKSETFDTPTIIDHLNCQHVQILDPHCVVWLMILLCTRDIGQEFSLSGHWEVQVFLTPANILCFSEMAFGVLDVILSSC